uniref:Ig-like domain-containing protein n=1 Tax=Stomoxys calcitrans TaxID=35570 RepID=A0A1I8P3Y2_STOCA
MINPQQQQRQHKSPHQYYRHHHHHQHPHHNHDINHKKELQLPTKQQGPLEPLPQAQQYLHMQHYHLLERRHWHSTTTTTTKLTSSSSSLAPLPLASILAAGSDLATGPSSSPSSHRKPLHRQQQIVVNFKQIINAHLNIIRWNFLVIFLLCNCIDFCISNKIYSHITSSPYSTRRGSAGPHSMASSSSSSSSLSSLSSSFTSGSSSLLTSQSAVSAFEPDFVIPLENVTVAQGRDATFTCVVNNLGGHRVAWIKADAKAILAIHEHVITNNDRLSVTHNDYNTWTLNIRNVKMEDSGKYMCQVNTDPMKMQTAVLEVVIPPDIINEETSGDMMVPEGGSAKLVCRARGHPKPRITWRREDGREIIARNGAHQKTKALAVEGEMLTLSKVTRSEMGAYMCIASNGVPPSVSKRMKLQVHFHPLVQVPNQLVGAPVLTDVTLICNVEASPKAINYWQRENGEMIIAGDRYLLTEKEVNMYSIEMVLHIRRLQSSDFGGYKCISKNSIGDTEGTIRLYEMERPGKKILREEDMNEVTKNEIVLKENRHEDGARNQNGRLYKERGTDANLYNHNNGGTSIVRRPSMPLIVVLISLILLLASTRTLNDIGHNEIVDDRRHMLLQSPLSSLFASSATSSSSIQSPQYVNGL